MNMIIKKLLFILSKLETTDFLFRQIRINYKETKGEISYFDNAGYLSKSVKNDCVTINIALNQFTGFCLYFIL